MDKEGMASNLLVYRFIFLSGRGKMGVLLITYDFDEFNAPEVDYKWVISKIESFDHIQLGDTTYLVNTDIDAEEFFERYFKNHIGPHDDFMVVELSNPIRGQIQNPKAEKWIDERLP
jgi:hypothetical protein